MGGACVVLWADDEGFVSRNMRTAGGRVIGGGIERSCGTGKEIRIKIKRGGGMEMAAGIETATGIEMMTGIRGGSVAWGGQGGWIWC